MRTPAGGVSTCFVSCERDALGSSAEPGAGKKESLPNQGRDAQEGAKGVSASQPVPGEAPGRSGSLWITPVCLFTLLTLEKENNLTGASSWGVWSLRGREAFGKGRCL